ncbi:hypothetical protein RXV95_09095 [Novosphingobium sp. ZN18A2]|uniref:hypothetical protein n=1 Tax=Novosphingobium sp. ZN18A2 TaxID=3079861 RepID=UPI0030CE9EEB
MKPALPVCALFALLAGCSTLPKDIRNDGYAHLAEATHAGPLIVRPDQVDEDSRCAEGTQCVWAGRVRIEVSTWFGGKPGSAQMYLGKPVPMAGGELTLDRVFPEKSVKHRIRPEQYVFHFTWTAAPAAS